MRLDSRLLLFLRMFVPFWDVFVRSGNDPYSYNFVQQYLVNRIVKIDDTASRRTVLLHYVIG